MSGKRVLRHRVAILSQLQECEPQALWCPNFSLLTLPLRQRDWNGIDFEVSPIRAHSQPYRFLQWTMAKFSSP